MPEKNAMDADARWEALTAGLVTALARIEPNVTLQLNWRENAVASLDFMGEPRRPDHRGGERFRIDATACGKVTPGLNGDTTVFESDGWERGWMTNDWETHLYAPLEDAELREFAEKCVNGLRHGLGVPTPEELMYKGERILEYPDPTVSPFSMDWKPKEEPVRFPELGLPTWDEASEARRRR